MPVFIEQIREITKNAKMTEAEKKKKEIEELNGREATPFLSLYTFNACLEEIKNQAELGKNNARFYTATFSVDETLRKARIIAQELVERLRRDGFTASYREIEEDGGSDELLPYTSWSAGVDISW